jgi:hypothetical protein
VDARQADRSVMLADGRAQKRYPKWRKYTRDMRALYGVTAECKPWTAIGKNLCGSATSDRVKHVVDVAFLDRLHVMGTSASMSELVQGFYCDVSQGVQMKKWGSIEALNTGPQHSEFTG